MLKGFFAGNVGKDAELKHTQGGDTVCSFSVGVNTGFGKNAETTWIRCSIWGKRAETLAPMIHKGSKVSVAGGLTLRAWSSNGKSGTDLECRVDDITLQSAKPEGAQQGGGSRRQSQSRDDDDIPDAFRT